MAHLSRLFLAVALGILGSSAYAIDCQDVSLPDGYHYSSLDECYFASGLAVIENEDGKFGYIDENGEIRIPTTLDEAWAFVENFAVVQKNGKWGYLKPDGSYLVKPTYRDAWGFSDGRARIYKNGKFGFIDTTGKEVIPAKYDTSYPWFEKGVVYVGTGDYYGLIDATGKLIAPIKYTDISLPHNERIRFSINTNDGERFGFFDMTGKEVIDARFEYADSFFDGVAYVMQDGEEFYINRQGLRTDPKLDYDLP